MKKTYLGLLIGLCALMCACQEEEVSVVNEMPIETAADNWEKIVVNSVFTTTLNGFKITKETLQEALAIDNVSSVHFVLETVYENLQVRVVGVAENGTMAAGVVVLQESLEQELECLQSIKNTVSNTTKLSNDIAYHVLQPSQAASYIQRWRLAFQNNTLEEVISYDGMRIRHFSMPANVVAEMASSNGVNLVWGVNPSGKLTTIFLPIFSKHQTSYNEEDYIYDFTEPCPSTCN